MSRASELTIGFALVIAMGCGVSNAAAQTDKYPRMAAIGQYLTEKNAEIQLARSAAPDSLSRDATILVLGRQGYETAVEGKNGFVCMVERGWMAAFDWPEFWNPKVRAADCLNPQAARSILPIAFLRSRMVMAGRSKAEILSAIKVADPYSLVDPELLPVLRQFPAFDFSAEMVGKFRQTPGMPPLPAPAPQPVERHIPGWLA